MVNHLLSGGQIHYATTSRPQAEFYAKMVELLESINNNPYDLHFTMRSEVYLGRYRVDFLITVSNAGSGEKLEELIVEHDEEQHQTSYNQKVDAHRDAYHLEMGYETIRVNSWEVDEWLERSEVRWYPFMRPRRLREVIRAATFTNGRQHIPTISASSIGLLIDELRVVDGIALPQQHLRAAEIILNELGIPFKRATQRVNGKAIRVIQLAPSETEAIN